MTTVSLISMRMHLLYMKLRRQLARDQAITKQISQNIFNDIDKQCHYTYQYKQPDSKEFQNQKHLRVVVKTVFIKKKTIISITFGPIH